MVGHKKDGLGGERETERARPNFRDDFEDAGQERQPGYGGNRKATFAAGE
jgi:hypothetical protein